MHTAEYRRICVQFFSLRQTLTRSKWNKSQKSPCKHDECMCMYDGLVMECSYYVVKMTKLLGQFFCFSSIFTILCEICWRTKSEEEDGEKLRGE